jgi:RNA polymerase sigma factor (TIGR02999 family)
MGGDEASQEVSRILRAADEGEPIDMGALLPLVYDKLRAIAAHRMASERKGHTLQATALVHEAYMRLVGAEPVGWACKAHFYAAAAEAMRRILIEHARKRRRMKRGGGLERVPLDVVDLASRECLEEIVSVDEAVRRLQIQDPRSAEVVKLRFYCGLTVEETAEVLGITDRTVRREWAVARAWLQLRIQGEEPWKTGNGTG